MKKRSFHRQSHVGKERKSKTTSEFSITTMESGVKVRLYVVDAKQYGNKVFSNKVSGYKVTVAKGYVYTYNISYENTSKYVNTVKGNIIH